MLVDLISITQITTIVPDAAVVLKYRDYKKNYVQNHGIILPKIINRPWRVEFREAEVDQS